MLSYQHIYHAGNFADAHKHGLLTLVLEQLRRKHDKFCVIDTHAGRGLYHFSDEEAQKKGEYKNGALALWPFRTTPSPLSGYFGLLKKYNPTGELETYPGSPQIALDILGAGGRYVFCELHPGEFEKLKAQYDGKHNIKLHQKDGFAVLLENMPPEERRGLAIIDPPYEIKTDYAAVPKNLNLAFKKWPQGIFILWYPLLTAQDHKRMLTALRQTAVKNALVSEVLLDSVPKEGFAMYGSGLIIINPPVTENQIGDATQFIASRLPAKATGRVFWLDNCKINPDDGMLEL